MLINLSLNVLFEYLSLSHWLEIWQEQLTLNKCTVLDHSAQNYRSKATRLSGKCPKLRPAYFSGDVYHNNLVFAIPKEDRLSWKFDLKGSLF